MAKASWAVVTPSQGSGNATINVSSNAPHTGRNVRTTYLSITAARVEPQTVTVTQQGKPAYVDAQENATSIKEGQNVTISGKSNSARLTFSLGNGNLSVELPSSYTAAGVYTTNGGEISGDPGASSEYDFSIVISVPANESAEELTRQIIVTDENGKTDTCLLTQASSDAMLSVSKTSLELSWTGEAVTFDITSNTSWVIK